jgi:hypothetical protein
MTITLPDERRDWLEARARINGFTLVEQYLVTLAEAEEAGAVRPTPDPGPPGMSPRSRAELDAMLDAGAASGPPVRVTPEFWKERERELARRMAARRGEAP